MKPRNHVPIRPRESLPSQGADQVSDPRLIGGVSLGLKFENQGALKKEGPTGSQVPLVVFRGRNERFTG